MRLLKRRDLRSELEEALLIEPMIRFSGIFCILFSRFSLDDDSFRIEEAPGLEEKRDRKKPGKLRCVLQF